MPERLGGILYDDDGEALLSYERAEFNHMPWADRAEPLAAHAASEVMMRLSGWRVSTTEDFAADLLTLGAYPDRHAHTMIRDLRADPPPPEWAWLEQPPLRIFAGIERPLVEVFAANEIAFPATHVDRLHNHAPMEKRRELFGDLLAGEFLGPLITGSATAVAPDDSIVGLMAVFERPDGSTVLPWIGTVFRVPDPRWRGLGEVLLKRALAHVASAGHERLGLAVTHGNPARRLYERLGFVLVESSVSVRIP